MYTCYENYYIVAMLPVEEALASVRRSALMTVVISGLIFFVLYVSIRLLVRILIERQVKDVAQSLKRITEGNLEEQVAEQCTQEFSSISDGINSTVAALKAHIAKEAARIDEELQYARDIQRSSLPALTRPFLTNPAFRLFVSRKTAKEVGGDFYDFYMPQENRLSFVIADVSGKGIPAAMFMMTGKTTLRDCSEYANSMGEAFSAANDRICTANETGMFITAWMGMLDLHTGLVQFANAGHNPPVLIRNGTARFLEMKVDLILGIMEDSEYETQTLQLQEGDILLLYTDGVTEAVSSSRELFGEKRLLALLSEAVSGTDDVCRTLCRRVSEAVEAFADGAPQADDITMLCLCYHPPAA